MTSTRSQSIILEPSAGRVLETFGNRVRFKVTGEDTGEKYAVVEFEVAPGAEGPPLHRHERFDEMYYVLEGTVQFRIDDERFDLGPGGFAYIERGTAHTASNPTDEPARLLIQVAPAGYERFFIEANEIIESSDGPPEPEAFAPLMARHDMVLLEPPTH